MSYFLQLTANNIIAKHGNNLSDILVLMPNQRSCTYFKNELKLQAQKAILAPEINTLQNWLLEQSDYVIADNVELVTELYNCHKQIGGELTLDDFIGTANVLLADFEELDLQMTDSVLFFKNLEMLQSMKTYEPGEEPTEYTLQYRKFWHEFGLLYNALRAKLIANKKGYAGLILRQVAEQFTAKIIDTTATEKQVYLIGFSGLNKVDEVMLDYFKLQHTAHLIWDADTYYVSDAMNLAGHFFRKYAAHYGISNKTYINDISTTPKNITIIGAAKNVGQVKVVADILQNKLKLTDADALDTVIVLPDEKLLSPLIAELPNTISALNITMGLTIAGSNPAVFIDILFRLYQNSLKYQRPGTEQRFYYKDVFDLLQHNYFRVLLGKTGDTEKFVEVMKKQNRVLIRIEELIKVFGAGMYAFIFEGSDAKQYAALLQSTIEKLLDKLINKVRDGNSTLATDTEITYRLLTLITNAQHIFIADTIQIKTYIALLKENFKNERVALEGDPVQGLQIMGLQETRSLDFKNVIFLSANEGILPSGKSNRSYIPYEMRHEFLTTYKDRDAVTAYLFYRLLHKAENVYVLYNTEPDELGGGEKSRFILQLQQELKPNNNQAEISDLIFAVDPPAALPDMAITIPKNESAMQVLDGLIAHGISPSSLNSYITCPLQFYFRYIAHLKQQEDMEENLEASTIGSAVHFALENVLQPTLGKPITTDYIQAQLNDKAIIQNLIRQHLNQRFDNESLTRGKNLLLYKVCVKLTREFLKAEIINVQQLQDTGLQIQLELLEGKLESRLHIAGKEVKIQGRIDRIERVGNVIQIADYKTSKHATIPVLTFETWEQLMVDTKFAKPVQLLIYAWLYGRTFGNQIPIRSGIYWLRESDKALDTLRVDKTNDILTADTLLQFEEKLTITLHELLNAEIPFTQTTEIKRCEYCEFKNICCRN